MTAHVHFCPDCNEYKSCVMDCDPVDWLDDKPHHQPWPCDDCAKLEADPLDIRRRALERTVGTSNFGWFQFHDPERSKEKDMKTKIHIIKFENNEVTIDYRPDNATIVIAIKDQPIISIYRSGVVHHLEGYPTVPIYDALIQDFADLHTAMELQSKQDKDVGLIVENYIAVGIHVRNIMRGFDKIHSDHLKSADGSGDQG